MAGQTLGIGVIGAGQIVRRHALAYRALPNLARLVAVADLDPKRAQDAKERYRFAAACADHRELLGRDDIDAVSICTPAGSHSALVVEAIEAGKHVLCEKPMATTLAKADDIVAAADRHPDVIVSFVFQLRSDPTHRRIGWLIREGHLGRALVAKVCVRLRKRPEYYKSVPGRGSWKSDGGGVVVNQAIHQLDALIMLMGRPVRASAVMNTFVQPMEAEDTLLGWVEFEGGAIASLDCTVCSQKKEFYIDILGERAGVRLTGDPDSQKFQWPIFARGSAAKKAIQKAGLKAFPAPPDPKSKMASLKKMMAKIKRKEWIPLNTWGHGPHVREFLESIVAGGPAPVPPQEGRRSLELATALYESAKSGTIVELPLGSDCRLYRGMDQCESPDRSPTPVAV
ncbi:MAG: Gfo/Idh/MocA family oxidoreductase [Planctomycetes bacterium]|nr:Gfo/Idh/MocA family oxidoreductase [Planctomycetota bacterium]